MFGIEAARLRAGATPGQKEMVKLVSRNYTDDHVEMALWQLALDGGSYTRAARSLDEMKVRGLNGRPIPRSTIELWAKSRFKNRYHEIRTKRVADLDEALALDAQAQAQRLGRAVDSATRQTLAGIAGANGVEASQILRNVAQARQSEISNSMQLRGTDPESKKARSLADIAKELNGLGNFVKVVSEDDDGVVVDAELVEEREALLLEAGVKL